MRSRSLFGCLLLVVFFAGCAGKNIRLSTGDPIQKAKDEFFLRYGFFITKNEMEVGYPNLLEPIQSFKQIQTLSDLDRFVNYFWVLRDIDPLTENNEFKEIIDSRINDIENEIFAQDSDIPGTRFDVNGGLTGDLARVYLLQGPPNFKARLSDLLAGANLPELIVWYYIDYQGRHLMRFLFYEKYNRFRVFKSYGGGSFNISFALSEISQDTFLSDEELAEIWSELSLADTDWLFRTAMIEFSSFPDIIIEGGNDKKIGALDPPDPVGLLVLKPRVLGQPEDTGARHFVYSQSNSFIPAYFRISKNLETGRPLFSMVLGFSNLDWESKNDVAESELELRISVQNVTTKKMKEFFARLAISMPMAELKIRFGEHFFVNLNNQNNMLAGAKTETLGQIFSVLDPGYYVANIYLKNTITKKYNAWREEIVIE